MTTSADVASVVAAISPVDALEGRDRDAVLAWLGSTDDVFRRVPPRVPPRHLVAYVVLRDASDGSLLLVDHRRSGLWLPAGGHVEPGEDPADTATREAAEELGVTASFVDPSRIPSFLTMTETVGPVEERHVDVSLWYLLNGSSAEVLTPNRTGARLGALVDASGARRGRPAVVRPAPGAVPAEDRRLTT